MKQQFGVGFIPYEIGDKIILKDKENLTPIFTIEDIRMIQYVKDKRIEFEVFLKEPRVWKSSETIEKRIVE